VIILQNILLQWIRERAMDRKISLGYTIYQFTLFFSSHQILFHDDLKLAEGLSFTDLIF